MEQVKITHTKYMIKILETNSYNHAEMWQMFQIHYEKDGKLNTTEMFWIKDNKIKTLF